MAQSIYIKYQSHKVHCLKFGEGVDLLIAFHGFGDRAGLFTALEDALEPHYTVYAIDLPYHGRTEWQSEVYHPEDIQMIIDQILERESQQSFSLMGFSFGGRIVQTILPHYIQQIPRLFLLAPDGIRTRWMFNLVMMPRWLRYLLRRLLHHPRWFIQMIGWFHRRGFITRFIHDFAYNHIYTEERRDRIFCTWISLDGFNPRFQQIKKLLRRYPIPVELYFGERDEVIPISAGKEMSEGMPNIRLHILQEGHRLVDTQLNELLKKQLKTAWGDV